jgi:tetratricopeptide (TPR) repeat protein
MKALLILTLSLIAEAGDWRTARFEQLAARGATLMQERDWMRARSVFEQALQYGTSVEVRERIRAINTQLYFEEGTRLAARRLYQDAALKFQMAVDLAPANEPAREALRQARFHVSYAEGQSLLAAGRVDEAEQSFRHCLALEPEDRDTLLRLQDVRVKRADLAHLQDAERAAAAALERRDWRNADRQVREACTLASAPPAFIAYAADDLKTAGHLSADPRWLEFLDARQRRRTIVAAIPWLGAAYVTLFLSSLYFGLRRAT